MADISDCHLAEYNALRSEQRTRLDCANRIIHYSSLLVGALTAIAATGYANANMPLAAAVLVIAPLLVMPLALAQQNEEMIVREIGDYFDTELRQLIAEALGRVDSDDEFFKWERIHEQSPSLPAVVAAFFRAALLLLVAAACLIVGWSLMDKSNGLLMSIAFLDFLLILIGGYVANQMRAAKRLARSRASLSLKKSTE